MGDDSFLRLGMTPFPSSLFDQKRRLRAEMREKRSANPSNNRHSFRMLADVFICNVQLEEPRVVASYCAFGDEMDPAPLTEDLRARGHKIALPLIVGKRAPLDFRLYEQGDRLLSNDRGILEPAAEAAAVLPDILLVPLLAFDARRNRLGYGGGYYDRTIADLRARKSVLAVGIGYACQQADEVPMGPHDIRMDKIVTELGVF